MAEINLRHYVQEIDDLIEEGEQLEMAIAHCRHILKTYPKHIDTYRLLGKAYLESKRYGDTADIFQRVLSAIPDDFVSHVGMAIIREDEGNIDSSIWHMERAAESKPGNPAIEQELKRLIGKRDGLEPQRVRPSRGALARMYSHGELFSYATTELKRALEEDPERPDLQVLLANTYWRIDQRIEAAKLCSRILEKLPYCRDANRITAALLLESGKTQEANSNMRRLISLDPYIAHMRSPMDEPSSMEASAVQVERLSWTPGQAMPTSQDDQPDWAASLGVDLHSEPDTPVEDEVPTWLKSPDEEPVEEEVVEEPPPMIHPFAGAEPPPGADIPDWMKDAGWVESDGTATEGPMEAPSDEIHAVEEVPDSEPIAPAEFPDWLTEMSPTDLPSEEIIIPEGDEQTADEAIEAEALDWITGEPSALEPEITKDPDLSQPDPITEVPTPDLEQFVSELDVTEPFEDLIEKVSESEIETTEPVSEPGEGDYFQQEDVIPPGTQELPPWLEDDAPGASETIVTWLGDKSKDDALPPSDDIPSWMRGTGPLIDLPEELKGEAAAAFESGEAPIIPPDEELSPFEESASSLFDGVEPPSIEEIISGPDSTALSLEAEQASIEGELVPTDETEEDEAPGWLQEIAEIEEEPLTTEAIEPDDAPDWIKELPVEDEQAPAAEVDEGAPDWLSKEDDTQPTPMLEDLADEEQTPEWLEEVVSKDLSVEEEIAVIEEQPDWLKEIANGDADQVAELEVTGKEPPEWLAGIEIPGEEAVTEVDEEKPPEWIQSLADEEVAEVEGPPEDAEPPDWITELVPAEDLEAEVVEEEEPPEWVKTGVYERPEADVLETDEELITAEDEILTDAEELISVDDQPDGYEEAVSEVAEPPSVPALQAEEAPDWLVDISTADAPAPTDMPPEEAPEWLQEVEIDEIEAAITPGIEEIEIEEPEEALEEVVDQAETDIAWEPEFEEPEEEIVPEPDTAELEAAEKEIESRLEWLQESAQAVAPEPEITVTEDEIGEEVAAVVPPTADVEEIEAEIEGEVEEAVAAIDGIAESIDVEIDDEEVSSFLEDLAESEMLEEEVEAPEFEVDVPEVPSPEDVRAKAIIEKDELPEDVEGGLEWLEQLATEDQIEEIVSPELPITTDEVAEADVPDWLQEVAEKAEDFSDEDADKAMLEALEELEIEVADEPAPESDADPSILDTLITRRTDLEEYSSELSEEEGLLEPEEPIAEREAGEEGMEPVFPPEATLQEDVHEEVEGEELIVEPEILTEAISVTEDTVMEEVVEDAEPAGPPLNMLDRARAAVQDGDLEGAVENYVSLINQKIELDDVIEDLRSAVNKTPDVPMLWQTLGDALMQSGEISEAIDAYRRGMEAV